MAKERPILMSGPLVQATIALRKTQTRRVIKPNWSRCLDLDDPEDRAQAVKHNPYGQPGDILYVRETINTIAHGRQKGVRIRYMADGAELLRTGEKKYRKLEWKLVRSIHMPKAYARLFLEIESVRVADLHQISGDDAIDEGMVLQPINEAWAKMSEGARDNYRVLALTKFMEYWDLINRSRGYGWDVNPHVFVVTYSVHDVLVTTGSH